MAGRPFGVWAYSYGPYSRWHGVVVEPIALTGRGDTVRPTLMLPLLHLISASVAGRSRVDPLLTIEAPIALSSPMVGQSATYAALRLYWEPVPGCVANWVVQPKPPYDCPEVMHG